MKFATKTQQIQEEIVRILKSHPAGATNAGLAKALALPYRTIQRNTAAMNKAGNITGYLTSGEMYGSAIWKLTKK
ncbi:MAG TPA: hypothetical protein VMD76_12795 [Candidatus Sulfotelmatobacter sp.]|nr:hypothetical protein [Candidatus Sulfotelmatobacter sp.]